MGCRSPRRRYRSRLGVLLWCAHPAASYLALPPLTGAEAGAASVVGALFGTESSSAAFARSSMSSRQIEASTEFRSRHKSLTYGEFDLPFFFQLLGLVRPRPGEVFCDVGSGCGRLVLAAALAYPWECACGVEVLSELHELAVRSHTQLVSFIEEGEEEEAARVLADKREGGEQAAHPIALAPCDFLCGEASRLLPQLLLRKDGHGQQSVVVFVYATAWPSSGPYLTELSRTLGTVLPLGSRVITVDKQLVSDDSTAAEWTFELVHPPLEAANYNTVSSVGYVYEVVPAASSAVSGPSEVSTR